MLVYTARVLYALARGAVRYRSRAAHGTFVNQNEGIRARFWCHPADIDWNFHLNNAKYLHVAELTRWQLLTEMGLLSSAVRNQWRFFAVEADVKFLKGVPPLRSYESVCRWSHDGRKWITFDQQLVCPKTKEVYADMKVKAVVKHASGKTVNPAEFVAAAPGSSSASPTHR